MKIVDKIIFYNYCIAKWSFYFLLEGEKNKIKKDKIQIYLYQFTFNIYKQAVHDLKTILRNKR